MLNLICSREWVVVQDRVSKEQSVPILALILLLQRVKGIRMLVSY